MEQAVDWIFDHAMQIIGGVILFVGILAVIAVASRQSGKANEKAMEDKDPREGE
jgi:hypothetical protein